MRINLKERLRKNPLLIICSIVFCISIIAGAGVLIRTYTTRTQTYTQYQLGRYSIPVPENYKETQDKEPGIDVRLLYPEYTLELSLESLGFTDKTATQFLDSYEKLAKAQQKGIQQGLAETNKANNERFSMKTEYKRTDNGKRLFITSDIQEHRNDSTEPPVYKTRIYALLNGSLITYTISSQKPLSFTPADKAYIHSNITVTPQKDDIFADLPFSFPLDRSKYEEVLSRDETLERMYEFEKQDPFTGNIALVLYPKYRGAIDFYMFKSDSIALVKDTAYNTINNDFSTIKTDTFPGVQEKYAFSFQVRSIAPESEINDYKILVGKQVGDTFVVAKIHILDITRPEAEYTKEFENFLNTITWKE